MIVTFESENGGEAFFVSCVYLFGALRQNVGDTDTLARLLSELNHKKYVTLAHCLGVPSGLRVAGASIVKNRGCGPSINKL